MPVLRSFRKKQKQILYILIAVLGVTFGLPTTVMVLFAPSPEAAATVFGQGIPLPEWEAFRERWRGFRLLFQRGIDAAEPRDQFSFLQAIQGFYGGPPELFLEFFRRGEADRAEEERLLLAHYAMIAQARRAGLAWPEKEIRADVEPFRNFLNRPFGRGEAPLDGTFLLSAEQTARLIEENILMGQLMAHVRSEVVIPYPEFERRAAADSELLTVRWASVRPSDMELDVPPPEEVRKQFDAHPDLYLAGERIEVEILDPVASTFEAKVPAPKEEELRRLYEETKDEKYARAADADEFEDPPPPKEHEPFEDVRGRVETAFRIREGRGLAWAAAEGIAREASGGKIEEAAKREGFIYLKVKYDLAGIEGLRGGSEAERKKFGQEAWALPKGEGRVLDRGEKEPVLIRTGERFPAGRLPFEEAYGKAREDLLKAKAREFFEQEKERRYLSDPRREVEYVMAPFRAFGKKAWQEANAAVTENAIRDYYDDPAHAAEFEVVVPETQNPKSETPKAGVEPPAAADPKTAADGRSESAQPPAAGAKGGPPAADPAPKSDAAPKPPPPVQRRPFEEVKDRIARRLRKAAAERARESLAEKAIGEARDLASDTSDLKALAAPLGLVHGSLAPVPRDASSVPFELRNAQPMEEFFEVEVRQVSIPFRCRWTGKEEGGAVGEGWIFFRVAQEVPPGPAPFEEKAGAAERDFLEREREAALKALLDRIEKELAVSGFDKAVEAVRAEGLARPSRAGWTEEGRKGFLKISGPDAFRKARFFANDGAPSGVFPMPPWADRRSAFVQAAFETPAGKTAVVRPAAPGEAGHLLLVEARTPTSIPEIQKRHAYEQERVEGAFAAFFPEGFESSVKVEEAEIEAHLKAQADALPKDPTEARAAAQAAVKKAKAVVKMKEEMKAFREAAVKGGFETAAENRKTPTRPLTAYRGEIERRREERKKSAEKTGPVAPPPAPDPKSEAPDPKSEAPDPKSDAPAPAVPGDPKSETPGPKTDPPVPGAPPPGEKTADAPKTESPNPKPEILVISEETERIDEKLEDLLYDLPEKEFREIVFEKGAFGFDREVGGFVLYARRKVNPDEAAFRRFLDERRAAAEQEDQAAWLRDWRNDLWKRADPKMREEPKKDEEGKEGEGEEE